jgi:hypothetical protein
MFRLRSSINLNNFSQLTNTIMNKLSQLTNTIMNNPSQLTNTITNNPQSVNEHALNMLAPQAKPRAIPTYMRCESLSLLPLG